MDFAYVTFTNNNPLYISLMRSTIESVLKFSTKPLIVYLKDIPEHTFPVSDRIIYRHIEGELPSIYYYKPACIIDALGQGLKSGYYIEPDDLITPICDSLCTQASRLGKYPMSPIHPNSTHRPSSDILLQLGVKDVTQPYIHAHVLFRDTNLTFLNEWFSACLKIRGEHWDETALNCMYWKYECKNNYLAMIDPWYEQFYTNTDTRYVSCSFHGCKDPKVQTQLLQDMIEFYTHPEQKEILDEKQTWWNRNVEKRLSEVSSWIGSHNAFTKIYSRKYITSQGYTSVVDLGCANATMFIGFQEDGSGIDYTGVDSCRHFVDDNNKRGIKTIESDVRSTPFADSSFDVVYSRHIIEHQPAFAPYLEETIRIARKEALHIFFKPPGNTEIIHYDAKENLYHNTYKRQDIVDYLNAHPKVLKHKWELNLGSTDEDALHIYMKPEFFTLEEPWKHSPGVPEENDVQKAMYEFSLEQQDKLKKELESFQGIWKGGFVRNDELSRSNHESITENCIRPYVKNTTTVLEIGCGRGVWTKEMLGAKKIYCLDALSAEHNNFWNHVGNENKDKITYTQVQDFSCDSIPDNSIDFLFSFDVFCHISYSGMRHYMLNLKNKLKPGAICFIMVADSEKYQTYGKPGITPGYNTHEEEVEDFDGPAYPGRWYWYGLSSFCDTLVQYGYKIIAMDMNIIPRDPITMFMA